MVCNGGLQFSVKCNRNFLQKSSATFCKKGLQKTQIILSTIIGREVQIRKLHTEKIIFPLDNDRHGIRLDAYVEEEQTDILSGDIFDIEPENKRREE